MSNYTQVNDYSAKDALAAGDANKVIKGSDVDAEFGAISTAIATKADSASPTFTGTVTATGATINVATPADGSDDTNAASTAFVRNMLPAGMIMPYAGTASPDTAVWLLCDGAAVSRTTYSILFALVSTTFGSGDGSTTFNVPDLRGRTVIGMDNYGAGEGAADRVTHANADSLGGAEGTEAHALTEAELDAHKHTVNITDGGHTHTQRGANAGAGVPGSPSTTASAASADASATASATTGITATTDDTGSNTAHENMSPYIAMGYLIKV